LVDLFICFSNSVVDFLSDCVFKFIKTLFSILEFSSVIVSHCVDLCLKLVFQNTKFVLESRPERLQSVIDSLSFSLSEVTICLNLALNVLKLSLELLFGLNAFHEHDIVVTVHLNQLVVHRRKRNILILLSHITCHVLVDKFLLGSGHWSLFVPCLHKCTSCCH